MDQAEKLRNMMKAQNSGQDTQQDNQQDVQQDNVQSGIEAGNQSAAPVCQARVITVTSGKGGVGKSSTSIKVYELLFWMWILVWQI